MKRVFTFSLLGVILIAGLALIGYLLDFRIRVYRPAQVGLEWLRSLPYMEFAEEDADPARTGVVVHEKELTFPGYNLFRDQLIDMEGRRQRVYRMIRVDKGMVDRIRAQAQFSD